MHIDLLRSSFEKIHYFGLGFIQLKIDDNIRFHFYTPELKAIVAEEEIHNHRYDFISTIMAGSLTQELFTIQSGLSDYCIMEESCKPKEGAVHPEQFDIMIFSQGKQTFNAGESYTCLSSFYHKVHTDFAITRLYRGQIVADNAYVIRKKGALITCPFSQPLSEQQCWEIVEDCINRASLSS